MNHGKMLSFIKNCYGRPGIKELTERGDVKHARISADGRYLHVDTIDGEFSVVMYSAVNICSRIANCELSFVKFDYTA